MNKKLIGFLLLLISHHLLFADNYYWVNGSGDWTDFENHWAKSSGDTLDMHTNVPGAGDHVFFDANSFTEPDQLVALDTSFVSVMSISWAGAEPSEFLSQSSDTIVIQQNLTLSSNLSYNHFGVTIFTAPSSSSASFETAAKQIKGDVHIDMPDGNMSLPSGLDMPQHTLYLLDGELDPNNEELKFKAFNGNQDTPENITGTPSIINADTIRCNQSFFLHDNVDVSSLNAILFMNLQSSDSCYISFSDNLTALDVKMNGNKKLFMQGPVKTTGNIFFDYSGSFYSNGFDLVCDTLSSNTSLGRTIDLGSSELILSAFEVDGNGLTLNASNAEISFNGGSEYLYNSGNMNASFSKFTVADAQDIFVQSSVTTDSLKLVPGSAFILKQGKTIHVNGLEANGTCGEYIHIRTYCSDDIYQWPEDNCVNQLPVIQASDAVTAEYLKIGFVKAQSATFTANNSYAEGAADGWTINNPAQNDTLYWVGNTGYWHDATNWASVSGGTPQTCVPNPESLVVFDDASFVNGDTVKLTETAYSKSVTWQEVTNNVTWHGNADLNVQDSLELNPNLQADYDGDILFSTNHPTDTFYVYTHGVILNSNLIFDGDASWQFKDGLISNRDIILNKGNLIMENKSISCSHFFTETDNTRGLDMKKADVTLTGDNEVWTLNPTNLIFDADSSSVTLQNGSNLLQKFEGGDLSYHDLFVLSEEAELSGSNNFHLISLQPGNVLWLEPLTITQADSLVANGNCQEQITISSTNVVDTAQIVKTGYDTLQVSSVQLSNVTADTTGAVYYEAIASDSSGMVNGWDFTGSLAGKTYYWIGNTNQWSDVNNWEVGGATATCLPTLNDTVFIDSTQFAAAPTDTIIIDKLAYCHFFDVSDTDSIPLHIVFEKDLISKTGFTLHDSVEMMYQDALTLNNFLDVEHGLRVMPDGQNASLTANDAHIGVHLFSNPYHIDDTVFLENDIHFQDMAGLNVISGHFHANENNIMTTVLRTVSDADKIVNIESSTIDVEFYLEMQQSSELTLHADSSLVRMVENNFDNAFFEGGGQQYYDLQIFTSEDGGPVDEYLVSLYGSNGFHNFSVFPGGTIQVEAGSTQTIDSLLQIYGTCNDRIRFKSTQSGDVYTFEKTNTYQDTVYSLLVSDMVINPSAVAMLSTDNGNNTNWIFDPTEAAIADFNMPYPACVENNLTFVNTSQSIYGAQDSLGFEWVVNGTDTLNTTDLEYYFTNQGSYEIQLTATDTTTHCSDVKTDTLVLVEHSANISATPNNLTICAGEMVSFEASSSQTVDYNFYINGLPLNLGDTVDYYETDSLVDGDEIFVETILDGCSEFSDTLVANVNLLPEATVNVSPSGAEICEGDTIIFTASGADQYQFYVNDTAVTNMSSNPEYSDASLADSAFVQVYAKDTASGCGDWSSDELTIRVHDNPDVSLSADIDPAEICDGETLGFTAGGASEYLFHIDGVPQGVASADNTFATDILSDGDLVTVEGISVEGCTSISDFVSVTVNPSPNTVLTSDDGDNSICDGEEITFTGSGAVEYLFFIDSVALDTWSGDESITSDTLSHQQIIGLAGRIGDCYDTATNITLNVYPNIELSADTLEICDGDDITFTASGDTIYQFYVDGIPVGPESSDNQFIIDSLTNGQFVSVSGTPNACEPDSLEVIVHPLPVPLMICSDADTSICESEEIIFTASGAEQYEFFVNGSSQLGPTTDNTYVTSSLNNGDMVSMSATSEYGCFAESDDVYEVEVRPYPSVSLTSSDPVEICEGDTVIAEGSGADMYEFFLNEESLGTPSTENSVEISDLSNLDQLTLEGTSNGCTAAATEVLSYTVHNLPNVTLSAGSALSVCEGDLITVLATGASEYEFLVNGISQGSPSSDSEFTSETLNDGDVISAVGYQNICSDTSANSIEVTINPIPDPILTTNLSSGGACLNDTLVFNATGAQSFEFFIDGLSQGVPSADSVLTLTEFVDGQIIDMKGYNDACVRDADTAYTITVNRINTEISVSSGTSGICGTEDITATAQGADTYEFFLEGASTGTASTDSIFTFPIDDDGITLSVLGSDSTTGCSEMSSTIYFNQITPPEITPESYTFCRFDSVVLYSSSPENNQWLHNGDLIPGANGDTYTANVGGEYTVQYVDGADNAVFSGGNNDFGQLGTGNSTQSEVPAQAITEAEITSLSAGRQFILALDAQGNLLAWGNNDYGNLGNGSYSHSYQPEMVPGISNVKAAAAGYYHSLAILEDSTVMSWGKNDEGQLGYGNFAASNFPNAIDTLSGIVSLAAGENHSLALDNNGHVYAWGNNNYGQLGTGDTEPLNSPHVIDGLENIQSIVCGANHNFAIDADGKLFGWGANGNGQLGLLDLNNRLEPTEMISLPAVRYVAAGKHHSIVYNENGSLYAMGNNTYGQLGVPDIGMSSKPIHVGQYVGITKLSAAPSASYILRNDKSLLAWGQNTSAQLLLGSSQNITEPQQSELVYDVADVCGGLNFTSVVREEGLNCPSEPVNIEMLDVPEVEIQQDELMLYVTEGIDWQWYLNGSLIPGATDSILNVSAVGEYSVLIDFANGCAFETATLSVTLDIKDYLTDNFISVSPNPSDGKFELMLNMPDEVIHNILDYKILTPDGRTIKKIVPSGSGKTQTINLENQPAGMYYLRLNHKVRPVVIKLIIR